MKVRIFLILIISVVILTEEVNAKKVNRHSEELKRIKRHLVYPMGGVFKLVLALGIPVKLGTRQSMAVGWNLQFQYNPAQNASQLKIYPPIIARDRLKREAPDGPEDLQTSDRMLFYLGLESILNKHGINGKACLLRSICENAMHPLAHEANGLYGELMHIAFTPLYDGGSTDLDPVYVDAQKAGEYGVDCLSAYPQCRRGAAFMDLITVLDY